MFLPGRRQIRIVAVNADNRTPWTDRFSDTGGNRSCTATHVEHGHPRPKDLHQTRVIVLERAAIEDLRNAAHLSFRD